MKESLKVATLKEARAAAEARRPELRGTAGDPRDLRRTLDSVVEKFREAHTIADKDYYSPILCDLKVHGPHDTVRLGDKRMADITADDLLTAIERYQNRVNAGAAGGRVDVRKLAQTIRLIWCSAKGRTIVKASPFDEEERLRQYARPQPGRDRRLEPGEKDRLLGDQAKD